MQRARENNLNLDNPSDIVTQALLARIARLTAENELLNSEVEHLRADQITLEDSRERYAELYDFISISCLTLDRKGVISAANSQTARLLGYPREWLAGLPLLSMLTPEGRQRFLAHVAACKKGAESVTFIAAVRRNGGCPLPVRLTLRAGPSGYAVALVDLRELESARAECERLAKAEREARTANQANTRLLSQLSYDLRGLLAAVMQAGNNLAPKPELPGALPEPVRDLLSTVELLQRRLRRLTVPRLRTRIATVESRALQGARRRARAESRVAK